jgi:hypothetical protein
MIRIERYRAMQFSVWNEFLRTSKNGFFLFDRNYMEYHSDRFADHSLLFYDDNRLVALLPANLTQEKTLVSHGGLTFGSLIVDSKMTMPLMLDVFCALRLYALELGLQKIIYKTIPHIYHRLPAEEDLYALFVHQARLYRRDVSSTIDLVKRLPVTKGRRGCIKKASVSGVTVRASDDFETFMQIDEAHLLSKHQKKPVHTASELSMLAARFPRNIHLFGAYLGQSMVGGVVVYESDMVAHAQYIAATQEGKRVSALDAILSYLLDTHYRSKPYFDFGISTTHDGRYIDLNLVLNKESFGARTIVYDFYEWPLLDVPIEAAE